MIQANELMIGNLCMRNGKLRTIDVNDMSNIWDNNRLNPSNHRLDEEISSLYEGIIITEEWLLKFGFNKDYKKGWIGIDVKVDVMTTDFILAEPLSMFEMQKFYAFVYDNYRFVKLEYIHQLQNLYFCITQKKLLYEQTS